MLYENFKRETSCHQLPDFGTQDVFLSTKVMITISFVLFNARSIVNKLDAFFAFISVHKPLIIGITETWARCGLPDSLFAPSEYVLFRSDRSVGMGGGVLLLVHCALRPVSPPTTSSFSSDKCNVISCAVSLNIGNIMIACVYRSPSSTSSSDIDLSAFVNHLCALDYKYKVIMGDFNMPNIDWESDSVTLSPNPIVDCFDDNFLTQIVKKPTRGRNILDLVLVNDVSLISDVEVAESFLGSDHATVWFKIVGVCGRPGPKNKTMRYDFSKADWTLFAHRIEHADWAYVFSDGDVNVTWTRFYDVIMSAAAESIPIIGKKNFVQGIPARGEVKRAYRARKRIFKLCSNSDSAFATRLRSEADARLKRALSNSRRIHESKVARHAKTEPKLFWSTVRSRLARKSTIQNVTCDDGTITSDDLETAETLNNYFSSIFSEHMDSDVPSVASKTNLKLDDLDFSMNALRNIVNTLPVSSAPGPDGMSYSFIRFSGDILLCHCLRLFKFFLSAGDIPEVWRIATVFPIYKGKGSKAQCCNYRPISLTPVLCKIMERLVKQSLMTYLLSNNLLKDSQHGFLPGRSTLTCLLSYLESVTHFLDSNQCIDVVYLDLAKAFDSVPHQCLLSKLQSYGIVNPVLAWIAAFLRDRKQCVQINSVRSSFKRVCSGIPQGSVLGPLLFLIYVDDVDDVIHRAKLIKYADDIKLYLPYSPSSVDTLVSPISDDLHRFQAWCRTWKLHVNPSKCQCLYLGASNPHLPIFLSDDSPVVATQSVCDLGVWLSSDLKPSLNCKKAAARGQQMLSLIKIAFKYLQPPLLCMLYKAFVRPVLEHCCCAWCPFYVKDIEILEKVQRRMTRILPEFAHLPYEERLRRFQLTTLKTRRLRFDLICVYRMLRGLMRVDDSQFFQLSTRISRNHPLKLVMNYSRLDIRHHFFSQRVVSVWNDLPTSCVFSDSVLSFKHALDLYLSHSGFP